MAKHQHGTMNIAEHERMFAGFLKFTAWVTAISIAVLIFLAIFNS